jgi:hypothetical protein
MRDYRAAQATAQAIVAAPDAPPSLKEEAGLVAETAGRLLR